MGTPEQQEPAELARPRNSWASAQESAAAFCAAPSRSEGRLVVGDYFIHNFKPDDYTRHSRCFPPGKEERSWALGYPETSGNKKEPLLSVGCLKGGQGTALGLRLCPLRVQPSSAPGRPGAQVEWDGPWTHGPRKGRSPGGCLAGSEDGPCRQQAASGRRAQRAQAAGPGTPHPSPGDHVKGL